MDVIRRVGAMNLLRISFSLVLILDDLCVYAAEHFSLIVRVSSFTRFCFQQLIRTAHDVRYTHRAVVLHSGRHTHWPF